MALKIIWNDICRESADAIVTPASRFPRVGTGLDKHVHDVAGAELLKAREALGSIGPGTVRVSRAFGLEKTTGAKWIIHALGPDWDARSGVREKLILAGCYFRILLKAAELKCRTVSVPVLSSGKFGMPMETAMEVAVDSIRAFLAAVPKLTVKLVGIDADFLACARGSYGAHYEKGAFTQVQADALRKAYGGRAYSSARDGYDAFGPNEVDAYFSLRQFERETRGKTFKQLFRILWNRKIESDKAEKRRVRKALGACGASGGEAGFLTTNAALADATGISERTIRNFCSSGSGSDRTTKDKIFALCVAMRLSVRHAEALLATCGFAFDRFSRRDETVSGWLEGDCGPVCRLNMRLNDLGLQQLDVLDEKRAGRKAKR